MYPPECIICLTEETTPYLLGEERRIVRFSGYGEAARRAN